MSKKIRTGAEGADVRIDGGKSMRFKPNKEYTVTEAVYAKMKDQKCDFSDVLPSSNPSKGKE